MLFTGRRYGARNVRKIGTNHHGKEKTTTKICSVFTFRSLSYGMVLLSQRFGPRNADWESTTLVHSSSVSSFLSAFPPSLGTAQALPVKRNTRSLQLTTAAEYVVTVTRSIFVNASGPKTCPVRVLFRKSISVYSRTTLYVEIVSTTVRPFGGLFGIHGRNATALGNRFLTAYRSNRLLLPDLKSGRNHCDRRSVPAEKQKSVEIFGR